MDKEYAYDYVSFIAPFERVQEYLDQFSRDWHIHSTHPNIGNVLVMMEQKYEEGTSHSSRPDLSRLNGDTDAADLVRRKMTMTLADMLDWVNDAIEDPEGDDIAGTMLMHVLTFIMEQPARAYHSMAFIDKPGAELITQAEINARPKPPIES